MLDKLFRLQETLYRGHTLTRPAILGGISTMYVYPQTKKTIPRNPRKNLHFQLNFKQNRLKIYFYLYQFMPNTCFQHSHHEILLFHIWSI